MESLFKPNTVEIFLSSDCNLQCEYCYISKNKQIKELDVEIKKAIEDGTYLQKIKEVFAENREDLKKIELWGGEPALGIRLFADQLDSYIEHFNSISEFFISTNFTINLNDIIYFIDTLVNFDKEFIFTIQVSIDGPEKINSANRCKDTNKIIEANLWKLVDYCNQKDLKKVKVRISFKPTLCIDNIAVLSEIDDLIDYFKYFDDIYKEFYIKCGNKNMEIRPGALPNFMVPGKYTTEDGRKLSSFIQALEQLREINKEQKILKYYERFSFLENYVIDSLKIYKNNRYYNSLGFCGAFKNKINIMHNGTVNVCHRGFLDFYEEYRENLSELKERNVMTADKHLFDNAVKNSKFNIQDIQSKARLEQKMQAIYSNGSIQIANIMATMIELARCGQISKAYLEDEELLIKAAILVRNIGPCLYDNIMTTGSFFIKDYSLIRLYCNGTLEFLIKKTEEKQSCAGGVQ